MALDSSTRVTLTVEGRKELYLNSPDRPAVSIGSGERYTASATFERELTPAIMAFLTLTGERRLARVGYLSHWKVGATAGIAITFDSLIAAIAGKWTFALSAGVRHQKNDRPDPVFSATNPKVTTQGFAEARLSVPVGDNFALESAVSYTVSRSNYGLDVFNNATASVGLSKGF